jgi:hypothetical protein
MARGTSSKCYSKSNRGIRSLIDSINTLLRLSLPNGATQYEKLMLDIAQLDNEKKNHGFLLRFLILLAQHNDSFMYCKSDTGLYNDIQREKTLVASFHHLNFV